MFSYRAVCHVTSLWILKKKKSGNLGRLMITCVKVRKREKLPVAATVRIPDGKLCPGNGKAS